MKVHLLHIPKTGGITFHRALQGAGVDVTRSHDPAQVPSDALVITLLRNPIDRAWSVYRYTVKQKMFEGTLREFLSQKFDPWWWGVWNVQPRYMRPGMLTGVTEQLDATLKQVCALAGVDAPTDYEWHGKDDGDGYTPQEYAQLTAAVGIEDLLLYEFVRRGF